MNDFIDSLYSGSTLMTLLSAIAAFATVLTLGLPMLNRSTLEKRMKEVEEQRLALRLRRQADLGARRVGLRAVPEGSAKLIEGIVKRFQLAKLVGSEDSRDKLQRAGLRGSTPLTVFMFFRIVMPIVLFIFAMIYLYLLSNLAWSFLFKLAVSIGAALFGFYLPDIFIKNVTIKRQEAIMVGFPDALDLLLICVESGMSVETAFNKVSVEIGNASPILAEEFALTTAELSYLPDRRQAFENFAMRCGNDSVQAVASALNQAEKYGTPLGQALRTCAKENREARMAFAEKKAASLPAKLTVPMILFFLPCLFIVIIGPAAMKVSHLM